MKPTNLKEHLIMSVDPENMSDSVLFVCVCGRKQTWFRRLELIKTWIVPTWNPCLEASCKAAYLITKQTKPYMNTEVMVNQFVLEMVWLVCSSQVVSSTLESSNSLQQVIEELAAAQFHFNMQLDILVQPAAGFDLLCEWWHHQRRLYFMRYFLNTTKTTDIYEMVKKFFVKQRFYWRKKSSHFCIAWAPTCFETLIVLLLWWRKKLYTS